jgi:asparagine synthase (glutamine-hydrolysing)
MCGIVGLIGINKSKREIVERMNAEIFHRGPDSSGFYCDEKVCLAMRRLKIIDLIGGDQPIFNEDKKIVVFFNGEIYNYEKIRDRLQKLGHVFITASDTEVLAHGYEEWGIDGLLKEIEGMFAFSLLDKKRNKVFLARDRFGEKPLYYFSSEDAFYFASELKSLLVLESAPKKINPASLYSYLALHHVPGELTILKDIYKLNAGCYLKINLKDLSFTKKSYWQLKESPPLDSYDEAVKNVRSLTEKSVKERMVADVPVGAFLSGGIDSSIITGIMSKYTKNLKTFSIGFKEADFDESIYSQEVSKHFGTDHHHFIFSSQEASDFLPMVIKYMDEPLGDQALLPVMLLSREASKYVKVVLGGEGADEIFGGYDYYNILNDKKSLFRRIINIFKDRHGSIIDEINCVTASGFPIISSENDRLLLICEHEREAAKNGFLNKYHELTDNIKKIKNNLRRAQFTDIYTWLVDDLLIKYDRMAMSASLEGRAPYLDSELANYAFNLPSKFKLKNGRSKYILREAFKDFLPEKIFSRKKHGFNLPMSNWLRGELKNQLLASADLKQDDLINNEHYKTLIENHLSKKEDRGRLLYSILVYRLWFKNLNIK